MSLEIFTLTNEIRKFKNNTTEQSWRKADALSYSNDYIAVLRIDSSNRAGGKSIKRGKMWSIIVDIKKSFEELPHWTALRAYYMDDLKLTPVERGELKGKYGIRFYNMSKDPTEEIVLKILKFIFGN